MSVADVESALVNAIAAAVYPSGTGAPSAVGAPVRAYRGWPVGNALDTSIAAGSVDVSVYSRPGMSKNTTRYPLRWSELTAGATTMTATVAGHQVTIGGAAGSVQLVGVSVSGVPHVYRTSAADTPALAAAALAALIPGATVAGAVITAPAGELVAMVGALDTVAMEVRREWQELQITVWSPTPELRDSVATTVDLALSQISFLPLADGTSARLLYRGQAANDATSKAGIWRQDIFYGAEFGLSVQSQASALLFPEFSVSI